MALYEQSKEVQEVSVKPSVGESERVGGGDGIVGGVAGPQPNRSEGDGENSTGGNHVLIVGSIATIVVFVGLLIVGVVVFVRTRAERRDGREPALVTDEKTMLLGEDP